MAIPENYIDKITKDGDSRIISPSADNVRVNNENFEGDDLDEVLDKVAQAIDDAGSGGTVTGVKIGDTTYEPTDGVVDLSTPMNGKVDKETGKGLSSNDYTTAEKSKLGDLPTKAELDESLADAGKVKTVSINGETKRPDANGNVDLGTVQGEKGEKGDTGNVVVSDGVAQITIVNDLTTGGPGDALSAEMGKRLRAKVDEVQANIQRLYNNLGNIAFWDAAAKSNAAPVPIDWGNPKHAVTLALTLTNAVVKHNGVAKTNGDTILVEEWSTLTLIVEAASGYALTTVTSSTTGATVTDLGNGTYSVAIVMGGSNVTLNVTASTSETPFSITYNVTHCEATTAPESVLRNSSATIVLGQVTNYLLPLAVEVIGATLSSYDRQTGTLVISNPTADVTINADGIYTGYELVRNSLVSSMAATGNNIPFYINNSPDGSRNAILVSRDAISDPCTWRNQEYTARTDLMEAYSVIPIPYGCTKIKIKLTNSNYAISIGILTSEGRNLKALEWTAAQADAREFLMSDHVGAEYVGCTIKTANNTAIGNDTTLATFGFELTFE